MLLCREKPLTTQNICYHFKFLALMLHMFFWNWTKILSAQIIHRKFPSLAFTTPRSDKWIYAICVYNNKIGAHALNIKHWTLFKYFANIQIFKIFSWNNFKLNGISGTKRIVRQQHFTTILFCICILCVRVSVYFRASLLFLHFYFFQNPPLSFCFRWCSTSSIVFILLTESHPHPKSNLTLLIRVRSFRWFIFLLPFAIRHFDCCRRDSKIGRIYKRVLPSSVTQWQHIYVSICYFVHFQLNFRLLHQFWLRFNNLV